MHVPSTHALPLGQSRDVRQEPVPPPQSQPHTRTNREAITKRMPRWYLRSVAKVETHLGIDRRLCGAPVSLGEGTATASFVATKEMAVDDRGLVHGGFVFGLADHAAMLAVNHPNVVLGSSDVRFLAPVEVGDEVVATATRTEESGKKHVLRVSAKVGDREVLGGTMTAFVLEKHVLER
jgi:acyl-coenzyme A thioesterase PaaI-like protein